MKNCLELPVMSKTVTINQSGNLLELQNAPMEILHPELSYKYRNMDFTGFKKRSIEIEEKLLYNIEPDGKVIVPAGMLSRILNVLKEYGYTANYTDLRTKVFPKPDFNSLKTLIPDLEFREGQKEIIAQLITKDRGIIVAPTGFGKSTIARMVCALYPTARIIIAAPSTDIIAGTYRRIHEITPDVGRVGDGFKETNKRITVCVTNSLLRADIEKCDIFIYDEVHTAAAEVTSQNIAMVRNAKMFGFTATPSGRSDGAELVVEALFGPILYKMDYEKAAGAGIISPIKVAMVDVDTDKCFPCSDKPTKVAKKRWCYWRNEARNRCIASASKDIPRAYGLPDDAQSLILVETVEHAFNIAKNLPEYTVVYANASPAKFAKWKKQGLVPESHIMLSDKSRAYLLHQFETGKLRKVIATSTWGTGVDFVNLDVLVYASGAPGEIRATQWPGRNSRKRPGKDFGLVIDFRDQWDVWTRGRAAARERCYKKHGWEIDIVSV